jgi:hypothetical protein
MYSAKVLAATTGLSYPFLHRLRMLTVCGVVGARESMSGGVRVRAGKAYARASVCTSGGLAIESRATRERTRRPEL